MLRAIRDVHSSCGIILVTGRLDAEETIEALRHGALACLARPLNADRLRDSFRRSPPASSGARGC